MHLAEAELELVELPLEEDFPLVQKPHVVAQVLKLPQVVARDHDGHLPRRDVVRQELLHRAAHHRIEPVERLVEQQQVGFAGEGEQQRRLPFHPLGKGAEFLAGVQGENCAKFFVFCVRKPSINLFIECGHLFEGALRQEVQVVRDEKDPFLDRDVLVNRLPGDRDLPAVGHVDPRRPAAGRSICPTPLDPTSP